MTVTEAPPVAAARHAWLPALGRWLLRRLWYVHSGMTLTVTIPPSACVSVIRKLCKPDVRLIKFHHLYAGGRRYKLYATRDEGFAVTTSSSILRRYRQRTKASAIVYGSFEQRDALTHLHLSGTIRITYLLSSFLVPAFFSSMVIYMPWHPLVVAALVGLLFGLSWLGHRLNAALEADEIMNFIQKALEEFAPATPAAVASGGGHVVYERHRDFADAWDKFYEHIRDAAPEDQETR